MAKKKKEKIHYIDDGRTIADMSRVSGPPLGNRNPYKPRPAAKEIWKTYCNAVKMMLTPMLIVVTALIVIYMVMYLVFFLAY